MINIRYGIPIPKITKPLEVKDGIPPIKVKQLARGHYFFDFGIERTAGLTLIVPAKTVAAWGGEGTVLEIRLGEQTRRSNPFEVCKLKSFFTILVALCLLHAGIFELTTI